MSVVYHSTFPLAEIKLGDRYRTEMGNVDELAESIREKGFIHPITISTEHVLLAGGRRHSAATKLGLTEVPVLIRDDIGNELDLREIELFENLHRKDLTWHEKAAVTKRIHNLMKEKHGDEWGMRKTAKLLDSSVGGVSDAVQLATAVEIMPDIKRSPTAQQARKLMQRAVENTIVQAMTAKAEESKPKLFTHAENNYKIGDALVEMAKLRGELVHIAEVDPPYAVDLPGIRKEGGKDSQSVEDYIEVDEEKYGKFIEDVAKQVFRIMTGNAFCIWWFPNRHYITVHNALAKVGFRIDSVPGIWHKLGSRHAASHKNLLANGYESFFILRKGFPVLKEMGKSNVWAAPAPVDRIHPAERPLAMIQDIIGTFSYPNTILMVPFLGSGNSLLAGWNLGLKCFGWDLSPTFKAGFMARVSKMKDEKDGQAK